jgi:hypothetical protein
MALNSHTHPTMTRCSRHASSKTPVSRGRMSRAAFLADVQSRFADAIRETDTPLEDLCTMMFEAPIRDLYDHRAFLNSQMRDAKRLGQALLKIVADVSLEHYQEAANDEPF